MRALALIVCIAGLLAAAASASPGSGLRGTVTRGPITPVCREGVPCDAPAAHVTLVFRRNGSVAARVETSAGGTYRVALRPGRYKVSTAKRIGVGLTPRVVRVPVGRFAAVDFFIDTGIQ